MDFIDLDFPVVSFGSKSPSLPESLSLQMPQNEVNDEDPSGSDHLLNDLHLGSAPMPIPNRRDSRGDSSWMSPLHMAAYKGHDKIVKLLVKHTQDCNERDSDDKTPLIHAAIGGHEIVVTTLLQNAARVSETDVHGRSAIHWAVVHQHVTVLSLLLDHCPGLTAAVNAYDDQDQTPLHIAIDIGFEEGVQTLLRYGADMCLRTRKYQ